MTYILNTYRLRLYDAVSPKQTSIIWCWHLISSTFQLFPTETKSGICEGDSSYSNHFSHASSMLGAWLWTSMPVGITTTTTEWIAMKLFRHLLTSSYITRSTYLQNRSEQGHRKLDNRCLELFFVGHVTPILEVAVVRPESALLCIVLHFSLTSFPVIFPLSPI